MIFPLSTVFWLALLTMGVFWRRRILLLEYADYVAVKIAEEAHVTIKSGNTPGDAKAERKKVLDPIIKDVGDALRTSKHPVVKSWVGAPTRMWIAIGFMVVIPMTALAAEVWPF